jgi:hypothetical protein
MSSSNVWPRFPEAGWEETRASLHRWSQIVGKVRMALTPPVNHYWHVPLYVSTHGLTTSAIPYNGELFDVELGLLSQELTIRTSWYPHRTVPLRSASVAEIYADIRCALRELGIAVSISTRPVEIQDPMPFEVDCMPRGYNALAAETFWRTLVQVDRVFKTFRGRFLGKASPVHFFWGGFDLAVTRFSGRRAPTWNGVALNVNPHVMHESYAHEVSSAGFWPGDQTNPPIFYSYAVAEPPGFRNACVPHPATYSEQFGEFVLPYEAVRASDDPDATLLAFLQSTYEAAASLGNWDRRLLEERPPCACAVADGRSSTVPNNVMPAQPTRASYGV